MTTGKRPVSRREFLKLGGSSLAGAALLGVAGCGSGGSGQSSGPSIGWQAIPAYSTVQNTDQGRVDYLKKAISKWEDSHKYSINARASTADVTSAMAQLLQQASQGRAADISQVDSYIFPRFYEYAHPLDDYLGDISPDQYFPFAKEAMTNNGKVMGLQFTTDVRVLYYRKDKISTPPASWDDLISTGKKMKSQGLTPYLFPAGRDEATVTTSLFPYFWAQGGELVDGSGNPAFGEGKNRDAMLSSFDFIDRCVKTGVTPKRVTEFSQETDINGDAASGKTAMFLGGNWQVSLLKQIMGSDKFTKQWGVAPIPSMSGSDHATTSGGWVWGIFTKDKKKQKAAVDFLKAVFVGDQGMAQWCNVGGYLPPRKPVFDVSAYKKDEYTDTFRKYLNQYARNRPASKSYQDISTALQVAVNQIVSGDKSPKQALDTALKTVSG